MCGGTASRNKVGRRTKAGSERERPGADPRPGGAKTCPERAAPRVLGRHPMECRVGWIPEGRKRKDRIGWCPAGVKPRTAPTGRRGATPWKGAQKEEPPEGVLPGEKKEKEKESGSG